MISWLQRTFQQHFRVIFAFLLVAMVIPFIFTIGSTPGIGRADHTAANREFFGHNLNSQAEYKEIAATAQFSATLQYGGGIPAEQLEAYMVQRETALHLADQLHLPAATPEDVTDFIQHLRVFMGPDGQFDNARYEAFRASLKPGTGLTQDFIYRVLAEDVRIARVSRLLAGPGFVLPSDIEAELKQADTTWTIETGSVDYATFDPGLTVTEAEVGKFFADNTFRYTIAPKVEADAVVFPSAEYAATIKVDAAEVRKYYDAHPSAFPKPTPAKGAAPAKLDPVADYAAVEPQVRQALVIELGHRAAVKAASDLAYSIYDGKVTAAGLDGFLASRGAKLLHLAPFTEEAGPAELPNSLEVAKAAFELSASHFYSEGISTKGGAVVLFWRNSLPSRTPTLAEVHDKARADALDAKKRALFNDFGRRLQVATALGLKAGKTFEQAATAAASPEKLAFKTYPPFTLRSQPKDVDPAVLGLLDGLQKGAVSAMDSTANDRGVIAYAVDKRLPDLSPANPRYLALRAQMAARFAQTTASAELREVADAEFARTQVTAK
jgi:peptidyl-prolyl cis-trans isomerase D